MANVQDRGPPSTAAIAIATAIVSALTGYYLGQAKSIGLFGGQRRSGAASRRVGHPEQDEESDMSDASSAGGDDSLQNFGELAAFSGNSEECKLVLVVRTDLGMQKGERRQLAFRFR